MEGVWECGMGICVLLGVDTRILSLILVNVAEEGYYSGYDGHPMIGYGIRNDVVSSS